MDQTVTRACIYLQSPGTRVTSLTSTRYARPSRDPWDQRPSDRAQSLIDDGTSTIGATPFRFPARGSDASIPLPAVEHDLDVCRADELAHGIGIQSRLATRDDHQQGGHIVVSPGAAPGGGELVTAGW